MRIVMRNAREEAIGGGVPEKLIASQSGLKPAL
jgi:hypothetical protein